jgi:hypothetical protein
MGEEQIERRKMVTLPQEDFEEILERAAERGARHALSKSASMDRMPPAISMSCADFWMPSPRPRKPLA